MSNCLGSLAPIVVAVLAVGCTGNVVDEDEPSASTVQKGSSGFIEVGFVQSHATGADDVVCPYSHPRGVGIQYSTNADAFSTADLETWWGPTSYGAMALASDQSKTVWVGAMCMEDAGQTVVSKTVSSGTATANCPAGMIATGGGGNCWNGKLLRNRPTPDGTGETPIGWKATCTSSGVTAHVSCWDPTAWGGSTCHVVKRDESDGSAAVACAYGETALSVGAWCGNGGYIKDTAHNGSNSVRAWCSKDRVATTAICCPDIAVVNL